MSIVNECENCSSIWSPGTEEYDLQKCSACGWFPGKTIDGEDLPWETYEEDNLDDFE